MEAGSLRNAIAIGTGFGFFTLFIWVCPQSLNDRVRIFLRCDCFAAGDPPVSPQGLVKDFRLHYTLLQGDLDCARFRSINNIAKDNYSALILIDIGNIWVDWAGQSKSYKFA